MRSLAHQISQYYKSFSGTDTLAFIIMPGSTPVVLGALTTISYSIFRNKKPVINIGRTNINGVTRGSRIFAGTMIFTLLNQHWLRDLQEQVSWLKGYKDLKVDELPLFDIMLVSANEYGNCVSMYIYGIDYTDEAQTLSVEDLFTENTFSFVARDISIFKKYNPIENITDSNSSISLREDNDSLDINRFYILGTSMVDSKDIDVSKYVYNDTNANNEYLKTPSKDLYYTTSEHLLISSEVRGVQELLHNAGYLDGDKVTGIFDADTDSAVRKYQLEHGLDVTGVVDDKTYEYLKNNTPTIRPYRGNIINMNGVNVYEQPDVCSLIVKTMDYSDSFNVYGVVETVNADGILHKFYKTDDGYVLCENALSNYKIEGSIDYPEIKYNSDNDTKWVNILQSELAFIYTDFSNFSGVYDNVTREYVKKFQRDNMLKQQNGIVDEQTWLAIKKHNGDINDILKEDNYIITNTNPQGEYSIKYNDDTSELGKFGTTIECDNPLNIKESAIVFYDGSYITVTSNINMADYEPNEDGKYIVMLNANKYNRSIKDLLVNNIKPTRMEYIIYPYGKKPFKYIFNLEYSDKVGDIDG